MTTWSSWMGSSPKSVRVKEEMRSMGMTTMTTSSPRKKKTPTRNLPARWSNPSSWSPHRQSNVSTTTWRALPIHERTNRIWSPLTTATPTLTCSRSWLTRGNFIFSVPQLVTLYSTLPRNLRTKMPSRTTSRWASRLSRRRCSTTMPARLERKVSIPELS